MSETIYMYVLFCWKYMSTAFKTACCRHQELNEREGEREGIGSTNHMLSQHQSDRNNGRMRPRIERDTEREIGSANKMFPYHPSDRRNGRMIPGIEGGKEKDLAQ
jgi:hypothetical protein